MTVFDHFEPALFEFLDELKESNDREWFKANKKRFEQEVQQPLLSFIEAMAPRLERVSPHMLAIAKKTGGSLFRIYRDTRFSKDKRPYKEHVACQFRHEVGKDVHAPGYYLHLDPEEVYVGMGIWRPDSKALGGIRQYIDEHQKEWVRVRDGNALRKLVELSDHGERLKRPPRGFSKDHPLIEDLKAKSFVGSRKLGPKAALKKGFIDEVERTFEAGRPFMKFLCDALDLPF